MKVARVYVGLGSNLDDPIEHVRAGMRALAALPESTLRECSSLYRTAPVGITAQPDFINAVCALDTRLEPEPLLQRLLDIERRHGRRRGEVGGGPRTLDLDLLLYGDCRLDTSHVTVPHPRLHQRAFVLYPLFEIAPRLAVPGRGSVAELRAGCAPQRVTRLTVADSGLGRESRR